MTLTRGKFVRVCILLDLEKLLPQGLWIEDETSQFFYTVAYENNHNMCFYYGKMAHGISLYNATQTNSNGEGVTNKEVSMCRQGFYLGLISQTFIGTPQPKPLISYGLMYQSIYQNRRCDFNQI